MIKFRQFDITDAVQMRPDFAKSASRQFVNCFEAFLLWRDAYGVEVCDRGGVLLFRMLYEGSHVYFYPFGEGDVRAAFDELLRCEKSLLLWKLNPTQLDDLQKNFDPQQMTVIASRDNAEYIYDTDKFRHYRGDKMKAKRNFVNSFSKHFSWSYEPLGLSNIAESLEFSDKFSGDDTFSDDNAALRRGLENFSELQLSGGVVRVDGRVEGVFVVAPLGEAGCAAGLFLRANHEFKGLIPVLYQQYFLAHPEYDYVNLGEDLGLDGLRQNKLSYNPDQLLELYNVTLNVGDIF